MKSVVAVRLTRAGRLVYCEPGALDPEVNAQVVVSTERGQELGRVVRSSQRVVHSQLREPVRQILRIATSGDVHARYKLKSREENALRLAKGAVKELGLPYKMVDVHYTLDGGRAIFSFTSEQRADFRRLINHLSGNLRCRVELRQVGPRDEAKLVGGLGRCGRPVCCTTWLTEFSTVTVRMAKEQALPISAEGLAGGCGRLRCCLRFEYEQYREVNKALPRIGERVATAYGDARVIVGHRLKETVSVQLGANEVLELPLSEVTRYPPSRN